jgi:hypothetical protein
MIRFIRFLCLCLLIAAAESHALGQLVGGELQRDVVITLDSGEIIKGPLVEQTAETYKIDHVILGELYIPVIRVVSMDEILPGAPDIPASQLPPPVITELSAEPPGELEPVTIPQTTQKETKPGAKLEEKPDTEAKPKPKPVWSGSMEIGMNGSVGNTDLQRARMIVDAKRKTESQTFDFRLRYQAAQTRGNTTENRLFVRAKNDWATSRARWRIFLEGSAERDQFRDFDWRLAGNSGLSYDAIKDDKTTLILRGGLGGSTEIGPESEGGVEPEGILAVEFRHKFNKNMTLTSNGELIPDLKELGEYRTRINAALETSLDTTGSWKLRIGIEDRYESNTTRDKKNDFDYFVSLVYRF